ncbi:hypothetical protein CDCA_CDCA02G0709 [Cyanidium caldarium]|uniref:CST complex subunit TEN1 n=1 Tax=Cyanidium caldarium TaxID=2771 RepID=A0AAV9IR02_CYACA|nr:hypothetical protein CDCA_CDCA02G0709 [Cyanidium caldarium]
MNCRGDALEPACVLGLARLRREARALAERQRLVRVVGRLVRRDGDAQLAVLEYHRQRLAVWTAAVVPGRIGGMVEVTGRVRSVCPAETARPSAANGERGGRPPLPDYVFTEAFAGYAGEAAEYKLVVEATLMRSVDGLDVALYEQTLQMRERFLDTYFARLHTTRPDDDGLQGAGGSDAGAATSS